MSLMLSLVLKDREVTLYSEEKEVPYSVLKSPSPLAATLTILATDTGERNAVKLEAVMANRRALLARLEELQKVVTKLEKIFDSPQYTDLQSMRTFIQDVFSPAVAATLMEATLIDTGDVPFNTKQTKLSEGIKVP